MKFSVFNRPNKADTVTLSNKDEDGVIDQIISDFTTDTSPALSTIVDDTPSPKSKARFVIVKEVNGSKFLLDKVNGISRVNWYGSVNQETASIMLKLGGDSVEFGGYQKLILDRRGLKEFDTEARIWMKGFIKGRAKRIVGNVKMLAMVNRSSGSGSIFANFIGSAIKMVMPNLRIKKFSSIYAAIDWVLEAE